MGVGLLALKPVVETEKKISISNITKPFYTIKKWLSSGRRVEADDD
ncbi:hypothetical protein NBG4_10022 [Candidatus Sulfobium mesophilum]|uniref:Uncharacterized protein n=1 Tax=Candidatus Sulfobium mesophilum TaxID=2016548 RepID=A0A2U3QDI8_9BACT|nr:hypothetical protein NBG4_10022 [Candidatus Sulfobium mesophilum]